MKRREIAYQVAAEHNAKASQWHVAPASLLILAFVGGGLPLGSANSWFWIGGAGTERHRPAGDTGRSCSRPARGAGRHAFGALARAVLSDRRRPVGRAGDCRSRPCPDRWPRVGRRAGRRDADLLAVLGQPLDAPGPGALLDHSDPGGGHARQQRLAHRAGPAAVGGQRGLAGCHAPARRRRQAVARTEALGRRTASSGSTRRGVQLAVQASSAPMIAVYNGFVFEINTPAAAMLGLLSFDCVGRRIRELVVFQSAGCAQRAQRDRQGAGSGEPAAGQPAARRSDRVRIKLGPVAQRRPIVVLACKAVPSRGAAAVTVLTPARRWPITDATPGDDLGAEPRSASMWPKAMPISAACRRRSGPAGAPAQPAHAFPEAAQMPALPPSCGARRHERAAPSPGAGAKLRHSRRPRGAGATGAATRRPRSMRPRRSSREAAVDCACPTC
jgi:hypothetical protein